MFLDHTRRRSTVGRTPLDEWSARRRDLYLTTHDTHNRQISMTPVGFEPTISPVERPVAARVLRFGRVISSSQRPLPDNTRHSQQTNIHAPGGIQTHDLSRRAACAAALLLKSWVRIPPGAWIFVCCECLVLSGRGLWRADHSSRGVLPTVVRRVWSRNIKNRRFIYIYEISSRSVNDLTLILLTWRKWGANNASK
jgi:hypothetical protein